MNKIKFTMRSEQTAEDITFTNAWDSAVKRFAEVNGLDYVMNTYDYARILATPCDEIWKCLYPDSTLTYLGHRYYEVDVGKEHFGVE
jgi:hypothetical protein